MYKLRNWKAVEKSDDGSIDITMEDFMCAVQRFEDKHFEQKLCPHLYEPIKGNGPARFINSTAELLVSDMVPLPGIKGGWGFKGILDFTAARVPRRVAVEGRFVAGKVLEIQEVEELSVERHLIASD